MKYLTSLVIYLLFISPCFSQSGKAPAPHDHDLKNILNPWDSKIEDWIAVAKQVSFVSHYCSDSFICAKIDCEKTTALAQQIFNMEYYLRDYIPLAKASINLARANYKSTGNDLNLSVNEGERLRMWMEASDSLLDGGNILLNISSLVGFLQTFKKKLPEMKATLLHWPADSVKDRLLKLDLIDRLIGQVITSRNALQRTSKVASKLLGENNPLTLELHPVAEEILKWRNPLSNLKNATVDIISARAAGDTELMKGGIRSLQQAIGNLLSIWATKEIAELKARIKEVEANIPSEIKTYTDARTRVTTYQIHVRWAQQALNEFKQTRQAIEGGCFSGCNFSTLSIPAHLSLPPDVQNQIEHSPTKDQDRRIFLLWAYREKMQKTVQKISKLLPDFGYHSDETELKIKIIHPKEAYKPGDTLQASYEIPACLAAQRPINWMAVVPSDTKGSALAIARAVRDLGTSIQHLSRNTQQENIEFQLPQSIQTGLYKMVFVYAQKGEERALKSFKVKSPGVVHLSFDPNMATQKDYRIEGDRLILPDTEVDGFHEFPVRLLAERDGKPAPHIEITLRADPEHGNVHIYHGQWLVTDEKGLARSPADDKLPLIYNPKQGIQLIHVKAAGAENELKIQIKGVTKPDEQQASLSLELHTNREVALKTDPAGIRFYGRYLNNPNDKEHELRILTTNNIKLSASPAYSMKTVSNPDDPTQQGFQSISLQPLSSTGGFEFFASDQQSYQSVSIQVEVYDIKEHKVLKQITKQVRFIGLDHPDESAVSIRQWDSIQGDWFADGEQARNWNRFVKFYPAGTPVHQTWGNTNNELDQARGILELPAGDYDVYYGLNREGAYSDDPHRHMRKEEKSVHIEKDQVVDLDLKYPTALIHYDFRGADGTKLYQRPFNELNVYWAKDAAGNINGLQTDQVLASGRDEEWSELPVGEFVLCTPLENLSEFQTYTRYCSDPFIVTEGSKSIVTFQSPMGRLKYRCLDDENQSIPCVLKILPLEKKEDGSGWQRKFNLTDYSNYGWDDKNKINFVDAPEGQYDLELWVNNLARIFSDRVDLTNHQALEITSDKVLSKVNLTSATTAKREVEVWWKDIAPDSPYAFERLFAVLAPGSTQSLLLLPGNYTVSYRVEGSTEPKKEDFKIPSPGQEINVSIH